MSYIDLNKPIDASFELNNICNLMCPQCARNTVKDGILQKNPDTNSSWKNDKILKHNDIDVSVAIALKEGLITPIIK